MATSSLRLTRDQLASFLQDHEQIKQFERLFALVDSLQPTTLSDLAITAGNADQKAVEALDSISTVAQDAAIQSTTAYQKAVEALNLIAQVEQEASVNSSAANQKAVEALDAAATLAQDVAFQADAKAQQALDQIASVAQDAAIQSTAAEQKAIQALDALNSIFNLAGLLANSVLYLNASKIVTTSASLTFDGTNFSTTGTSSATKLIPTGGTAAGDGIYLPSANTLALSTNGVERVRIDSIGNAGLGVTPSAWSTTNARALQIGSYTSASSADAYGAGYGFNAYYNGTNHIYISSNSASILEQSGGAFRFKIAALGTAGNVISFTQAMTLDADGELGVGITSPTARVHAFSITAMKQMTVDGTGAIKTGINFANGGTTYGQIYFDNNSPYDMSVVQQYTTGSLIFGTNTTERARITSAGSFVAGAQAALSTTATDGFLYVPTCAGTPTGTPTAITGMAPIVVNTTNNKMYFYSGGAWRDAGP